MAVSTPFFSVEPKSNSTILICIGLIQQCSDLSLYLVNVLGVGEIQCLTTSQLLVLEIKCGPLFGHCEVFTHPPIVVPLSCVANIVYFVFEVHVESAMKLATSTAVHDSLHHAIISLQMYMNICTI